MKQWPKSKVLKIILLAFILGVGLASLVSVKIYLLAWIILLPLWLLIFIRGKKAKIIALIILFFIFGLWRYQLAWPKMTPDKIYFYADQKITFEGVIIKEPLAQDTDAALTVSSQRLNQQKITGRVLVKAPLYSSYQYGQLLEINCRLVEPENFGQFNYQQYLAKDNIFVICQNPTIKVLAENRGNFLLAQIFKFKQRAQDLINKNFTEPQGALLSSLILGLRAGLPDEFKNWLSQTGTSHIVAISGLHIVIMMTIIEMLLFGLVGLKRKYAFYFTVLFIIFFVILTGCSASVIRAGIMGLLLLYAKKIGRLYRAGNIIFLAAVIMLIFNPRLLRWDVSWQLSFLSALGLIYLSPRWENIFRKIPNPSAWPIRSYLVATFSAYLFTLPLILYYFGNLSLVAPLTNVLILGVLPWVMIGGLIFIISGLIWGWLAKILVWPCWLLLTYVIKIIKICAHIPFLSFHFGSFSDPWIIIYFILLFITIKFLARRVATNY